MYLHTKIYRLIVFTLLVSLLSRFGNANKDIDDDNAISSAAAALPQDDEALRSIRDYIDLLTINWNGRYSYQFFNSVNGRIILDDYLNRISSAYARVLHSYNNNYDLISRTIHREFMAHVITQIGSLTRFNDDTPILEDSTVVQLNSGTDPKFDISDERRRQRWSPDQSQFPRTDNFRVPYNELRETIRMRNPYSNKRPNKPYKAWEKSVKPETWTDLDPQTELSWNHFVPWSELNYLFQSYNRLWLQNNRGRVYYADLMLMWFEIRLARLSILREDSRMNAWGARNLLIDDRQYMERAAAYNAWPAGNLFIGPIDLYRFPRPSQHGADKFERQAAEVLRPEGWAEEGQQLTRDIQSLMEIPQHQQNLDAVVGLLDRYSGLLLRSGSAELWAETGQGVPPSSRNQYVTIKPDDIKRQLAHEAYEKVEKQRPSIMQTINHELDRIRERFFTEKQRAQIVENAVENHLDKVYTQLLREHYPDKLDYYYTFAGDGDSKKWQDNQKTAECTAKKVNVEANICGENLSLGTDDRHKVKPQSSNSVVDSSILSSGVNGSVRVFSTNPSNTNSRIRVPAQYCGTSNYQENVFIDPTNVLSNAPRPDLAALRVSQAVEDDLVEEMKNVILEECKKKDENNNTNREPRLYSHCSMEILNDHWNQCMNSMNLIHA